MTAVRGLTRDDLLDLRVGQRAESPRFVLLNRDLVPQGDLHPDLEQAPTIENNVNAQIKRTMSGMSITPDVEADINPLSDRVLVRWQLEIGEPYDLGVFLFSDTPRERRTYGRWIKAGTMYDQLSILDQPRRPAFSAPKGATITDLLGALAAEAAVPFIDIDDSTAAMSAPAAWPPGESRLKIMNELCERASFYSPYFNNSGVLRCQPVPDLQTSPAAHTYSLDESSRVYPEPAPVERDNLIDAPNVYLVVSNSGTTAPVAGSFEIPESSPHSVANRGYEVVKVIQAQGVATSAQARSMAKAAAQQDDATYRWAEFDAAPDPRHDTFDIVDWDGWKYREQSWRLTLAAGGPHHHELRRLYADA